jgi:hypothetical protein
MRFVQGHGMTVAPGLLLIGKFEERKKETESDEKRTLKIPVSDYRFRQTMMLQKANNLQLGVFRMEFKCKLVYNYVISVGQSFFFGAKN